MDRKVPLTQQPSQETEDLPLSQETFHDIWCALQDNVTGGAIVQEPVQENQVEIQMNPYIPDRNSMPSIPSHPSMPSLPNKPCEDSLNSSLSPQVVPNQSTGPNKPSSTRYASATQSATSSSPSFYPSPNNQRLPSNVEYRGEYDFQINLGQPTSQAAKSVSWTYSPMLKKLFVDRDKPCPIHFKTVTAPPPSTYIRVLPIFRQAEHLAEIVTRCPNHVGPPDDFSRDHVVLCSDPSTVYYTDVSSGRHSLLVPYVSPAGTEYSKYLFIFKCFISCVGGLNRRKIQLVFTLENEGGNIIGRQVLDVRVCAYPGRDRRTEEKAFERSKEPQKKPLKRGNDPECIKAYEKALGSGNIRCNRSRIMVVGPAGVGKTSLIHRLTGQLFNPAERSTVGTEHNTVKKNVVSGWKVDNDTNRDEVAECMVLHEQSEEQEQPLDSSATPSEAGVQDSSQNALKRKSSPEHHSAPKRHKALAQELTAVVEVADSSQHALKCKSSPEHHSTHKRHKALAQELTEERIINATSTANDISYSIWDFGGQVIYYITHPLFLSWRSLYIVVFPFHVDFNAEPPRAEEINIEGATPRTHRTILDLLHFWLMSIYVHAVPPRDRENFEPKILLVGTFRHEPGITEEDVKCKKSQIKKMVRGKPYAKQIHSEILQIDNSSSSEKEVNDIQEQIDKLVKESAYMQEDLPIRWRTFSDEMRALKRDTLLLNEARTAKTDERIIEDIEVEAVLEFYHNIGDLVYHQGCELIVLNPQILNNFVSNIITVVDDEKLEGALGDDWKILIEKGILRRTLLEAVWESNKGKPNELKYLIDMMVRFDLICKIPEDPQLKNDVLQGCYFVPCCTRPELGKVQKPKKDNMEDEFEFIIDFHKFLPDGFLHRLYVRMALWSMIGCTIPYKPTFHCREMLFYIDEQHRVVMTNTIEGDDAHRIKVLIFRPKPRGAPENCDKQPICLKRDFLTYLKVALEDLKMTWARRISYSLGLPCTYCRDEGETFSLVLLEAFLECKDLAHCGECGGAIPAGRVKQALLCSPANSTEDSSESRKDLDIEKKLLKLSKEMPTRKYFELCNEFGIGYNEAESILKHFSHDYAGATIHCLIQWKMNERDCLSKLKTILREVEVGDLVKYIE